MGIPAASDIGSRGPAKESLRLRRSYCLIARWEDGEFLLENYLSGRRTVVSMAVLDVVQRIDGEEELDQLLDRFGGAADASGLFEQLVDQDVLCYVGSAMDRRERALLDHWKWGLPARYYHFTTQRVHFDADIEGEDDRLAARAAELAPPSPFKGSDDVHLPLPDTFDSRSDPFWNTLRARRTERLFTGESLTLAEFATIIQWTWGPTKLVVDPRIGSHLLKTSPSGGARHPIEVYPVVLAVDGVAPGVYHYSTEHHGLVRLSAGDHRERVVKLCGDQPWVGRAAVVFFMVSLVERSMWKYEHDHAYRINLLDAGHLGQTFHLVCTHLGLGPLTTGAMHAQEVERTLGIDGIREVPLYAACVGRRAS